MKFNDLKDGDVFRFFTGSKRINVKTGDRKFLVFADETLKEFFGESFNYISNDEVFRMGVN